MGFQEDAPPVDSPLLQEGLSNSRSVFWVLFLHKTMIWQCFLNKRNLGSLQNIAIKVAFIILWRMLIFVASCLMMPAQTSDRRGVSPDALALVFVWVVSQPSDSKCDETVGGRLEIRR